MSLTRTLSEDARRKAAISKFNAGARPFTPGVQWMKPISISWHKLGVSSVKYFDFNLGSISRSNGLDSSLSSLPMGSIKLFDHKASSPFLIPSFYTAQRIINKRISSKKLFDNGFPSLSIDS